MLLNAEVSQRNGSRRWTVCFFQFGHENLGYVKVRDDPHILTGGPIDKFSKQKKHIEIYEKRILKQAVQFIEI